MSHPLSEGQREKSHLTVRRWESEKHESWSMPVQGFLNHVAADGSLLGVSVKWSARGWSVVHLDRDEEMGPNHGMYGTLDAELEVQRTTRRADLTAFVCFLRKAVGPTMVHVDNKGITDGTWRGEMRYSGPRAKGRRLVDFDLGSIAQGSSRRHHWW